MGRMISPHGALGTWSTFNAEGQTNIYSHASRTYSPFSFFGGLFDESGGRNRNRDPCEQIGVMVMAAPPIGSDTLPAIHTADVQYAKDSSTQAGAQKCLSVASRKRPKRTIAVPNIVSTSWVLANGLIHESGGELVVTGEPSCSHNPVVWTGKVRVVQRSDVAVGIGTGENSDEGAVVCTEVDGGLDSLNGHINTTVDAALLTERMCEGARPVLGERSNTKLVVGGGSSETSIMHERGSDDAPARDDGGVGAQQSRDQVNGDDRCVG